MVAVLLSVTGGGICLGSAVLARHRAQAAADLAAVAAAARLPAGIVAACAQASQLSRRMQAHDIDCVADGLDVVVTVEVTIALANWGAGRARAAARAGPIG
ncbi:MAG TPA: Rv3654c family TadE-like protein [Mycobacterium sp.]|nr:Rv3654c family TadE-like protein [Mycobacterium sp.]